AGTAQERIEPCIVKLLIGDQGGQQHDLSASNRCVAQVGDRALAEHGADDTFGNLGIKLPGQALRPAPDVAYERDHVGEFLAQARKLADQWLARSPGPTAPDCFAVLAMSTRRR